MTDTFVKTNNYVKIRSRNRKFDVWVVVRHTRSGDIRMAVTDDVNENSRLWAMEHAERIANEAARDYGTGSASVFKGTLTLAAKCEQP